MKELKADAYLERLDQLQREYAELENWVDSLLLARGTTRALEHPKLIGKSVEEQPKVVGKSVMIL